MDVRDGRTRGFLTRARLASLHAVSAGSRRDFRGQAEQKEAQAVP
jgi:hypothetical protein